jgi:hypothetical protein
MAHAQINRQIGAETGPDVGKKEIDDVERA